MSSDANKSGSTGNGRRDGGDGEKPSRPFLRLVGTDREVQIPIPQRRAPLPQAPRPASVTNAAASSATTSTTTSTARKTAGRSHVSKVTNPMRQPIRGADDARWLLAVRTASMLQGDVLRPEQREKLMKLGKQYGLSAFDAGLVIAIVQDQARRGHDPDYCPTAGQAQLELISPANRSKPTKANRWVIFTCVAAIIALEIIMLKAWLF